MAESARGAGEPIRVVQFLWRLSPIGGIPHVGRTLLKGIDRGRFDVHTCTARPLDPTDRLDGLGAGVSWHSLDLGEQSPSVRRRVMAALGLARLLRRVAPDVVHIHSGVAWYLLPWAVGPARHGVVILDVHDAPQSGRVSALNSRAEAFLLRRRFVRTVVHSASVATQLAAATGVPSDSMHVVPLGIATGEFGQAAEGRAWRESHSIGPSELVVTYVARLVPSKDPQMFVRVAAEVLPRCPNCRFVLVGDGSERAAVRDAAEALGVGDRLLMVGAEPVLAPVLAATDIFLSTSVYEGFGLGIVEAMASSVPVVATSVGGVPEVVDAGATGVLVAPDDVDGLVDAVILLLNDEATRRRMGLAARARATERFDVQQMIAAYEHVYRSVADEVPAR